MRSRKTQSRHGTGGIKMDKEYIEREAALNASKIVYIECIEVDGEVCEDGIADDIPVVFKKDIEALPTADVVPIRHGKWNSDGSCSCCGCFAPTDDANDSIWRSELNYCYYCGAKMDVQNV
jgi:hypothetical protein